MYMSVEKNHSKQSTRFEQKGVCVCMCVCVCVCVCVCNVEILVLDKSDIQEFSQATFMKNRV